MNINIDYSHLTMNNADLNNLYTLAQNDYVSFWDKLASENLEWTKKYEQVLDSHYAPNYNWFTNSKFSFSANCFDHQIQDPKIANKLAFIFEDELGNIEQYTFKSFFNLVNFYSHDLNKIRHQYKLNDDEVITIYMPLCIDAIAIMHACIRFGYAHNVVFAGFSAKSLEERITDSKSQVLYTANGFFRKEKIVPLLKTCLTIASNTELKTIRYIDRCDKSIKNYIANPSKDLNLSDTNVKELFKLNTEYLYQYNLTLKTLLDQKQDIDLEFISDKAKQDQQETYPAKSFDANKTSFILYTSGSTGKPKGIVHGSAGYALWAKISSRWVFDFRDDDIYWCTADIGWITGHTYVAYGPLMNGCTQYIYEGAINSPNPSRIWRNIEKHKISILYTAPTAIRLFKLWGAEYFEKCDLSSLRLLGSVGEPIGEQTWQWFFEYIGKSKLPIVDTWWQTETGGIMISSIPGLSTMKAGIAGKALRGIFTEIDDSNNLYISKPWPSMLKTVLGDNDKYIRTYFEQDLKNKYCPNDIAYIDADELIQIQGRNDDVVNISGHRLSTAEIENTVLMIKDIDEAAAVAIPHKIKGEALIIFISSKITNRKLSSSLSTNIIQQLLDLTYNSISSEIGKFAMPDAVYLVPGLPKTRSGKIMRRILKDIASGNKVQNDISTLEDPSIIRKIEDICINIK